MDKSKSYEIKRCSVSKTIIKPCTSCDPKEVDCKHCWYDEIIKKSNKNG